MRKQATIPIQQHAECRNCIHYWKYKDSEICTHPIMHEITKQNKELIPCDYYESIEKKKWQYR